MRGEPSSGPGHREAARLLGNGDVEGAFGELRGLLTHPSPLEDDGAWSEVLSLFAEVMRRLAGDELATVVARAGRDPRDVDALGELGYRLYDEGLHGIAAAVLTRAHELAPKSAALLEELVANLEALMMNEAAVQVLRGAPNVVERDPLVRYLLAFNTAMCGDLDAARQLAPTLRSSADGRITALADALDGILDRAAIVSRVSPLDDRDLRGWHLVLNGGLLLHRSPHGLDEPMRGRYAFVNDSLGLCRAALDRLALTLRTAYSAPVEVVAFPDRSSRILAAAAAELLDLPLGTLPGASIDGPCLVVAYDLDRVADPIARAALREHRPGQVLFAHASSWTSPFPYTPDVTTYLHQLSVAPWEAGGLSVARDHGQVTERAEDTRPIEVIAKALLAAEPDTDLVSDDPHALLEQVRAISELGGPHAAGLFRTRGPRARQRSGSPVKSARFA